MARVLLIDPPFSAFMGFSRWFFPMGPAVLADFLIGRGHDVLVYDADHIDSDVSYTYREMLTVFENYRQSVDDLSHPAYKQIAETAASFRPHLVGITCMSVKTPAVLAVAQTIKSVTDAPVACGGPHATAMPEHLLQSPYIDYVIRESGLAAIDLLVDHITDPASVNLTDIPNLSCRSSDDEYTHNPAAHRNWDAMSWSPARSCLRAPAPYSASDLSMVMASIGCPFKCRFCSKTFGNQIVHRQIGCLAREVEDLTKSYGVSFLHFKDDTMGTDRARFEAICDLIAGCDAVAGWECLTRIDVADDRMLARLRRSKCSRIKVGVESGSPRILDKLDKRITPADVVDFSKRAEEHGLHWSAFYMIGLPDETPQDIRMTLDLIEQSRPDHVSISIFTPYPGSHFYDRLKRENRMTEPVDWAALDPFSLAPQFERAIPHDEFVALALETAAFVDHYNQASTWADRAQSG
ncbi:MAG: B12-binding domain-containing radical SAM protein [Candidatus Zixiibacteriota bacterium]|nr:MAG: B12-binding domain-containing radical SAM protein [candidate division Zixibacteria bacterium]